MTLPSSPYPANQYVTGGKTGNVCRQGHNDNPPATLVNHVVGHDAARPGLLNLDPYRRIKVSPENIAVSSKLVSASIEA